MSEIQTEDQIQLMIDEFNQLYGDTYDDPSFVYSCGSCLRNNHISVYKKTPETTINENLPHLEDPNYAIFRAKNLLLVGMYDPFNLKKYIL